MRNRYLYSRLVYSMAYVCAAAIILFAALDIPNDILIAFAVACLVAGGFINTSKDQDMQKARPIRMTTIDQEMREARRLSRVEK